ncbi:MAG: hypothetical protein KC766_16015, partial [Myxococcales bacterium]|nr:hypothetical protein [Myxococcales bacterium]
MPKGAGTIKGMGESFSAQLSTGIATYGVAFALPTARGAAQPDLGLSYSSSAGFGNAGAGWSIDVPFIARQTDRGVPNYEDGSNWQPNQDRFVFNGAQELVPICDVGPNLECVGALDGEVMPVWARGWQYHRARVEGAFVRFFWSPDRQTWRAQTKEGVSMELGVPLDGSGYTGALEANPEASGEIYRWFVAREYDAYGVVNPEFGYPRPLNSVYYRYISEGNSVYLSDIYDTTPADDPLTLDFDRFAHHTHLEWEPRPDENFSYRSGWRMAQNLRLVRVDVTSATFGGTGGRRLVRRYELGYDSAYHVSLLDSVTLRGRCAWGTDGNPPQEVPEVAGNLPKLIPCVTDNLPPLKFGYSHVGPAAPDGFEPFDDEVRTLLNSPPHSVDEQYTDLFDVNSDGLPDVLVTAPGQYGSGHGVFFNGQAGQPETFGNVEPVALQGLLGANASTMSLKNPNLVPLDLDGDGIINLLHMPQAKTYATYAPVETATGWQWQGRVLKTASGLDPLIDFGNDATETQVMDVNFDGLVDVVVSSGSAMRTFFSLGRFPHGDGQFGNGTWSGAQTADLRNDPVEACLPWSSEPLRFSDPDVHVAEMNGDGIPDLVRVRRGDVRYWPGRGNGFWGTGNRAGCADGSFATGRHIEMADSPSYSDLQGDSLRMDDVNGDGLTDLVQVRFDEVDIWLNVNGTGWTQRRIIDNTPASPSYAKRVRLVDVDGSGTRDILWGNGGKYQYIDLEAGSRPWLLTSVENGLGKSTSIEYSTSTDEMLEAEAEGKPWSRRAPMVLHVVKRVTERDNLNVAGQGQRVYVNEYGYRDAVYEPQQREFRGFREAKTTDVGDSNSPTSIAHSRFLLGECQDEDSSDDANPCAPDEIWRDNPREALKGLSFLDEELDEQGVYASTAHTRYALRTLYKGMDGREVRYAVTTGSTTWLYDTANPSAFSSPTTTSMLTVDGEGEAGRDQSYSVTQRAVAGTARIESAAAVDAFGNQLEDIMFGCTAGCPGGTSDEVITDHMTPILLPHGSGWLWRNASTYTTGSQHPGRRESQRVEYSPEGAPTAVYAELEGTLPLDRMRPGTPSTAGVDVAALPSSASHDTPNLFVSASEFDEFGNIVRSREAGDRCGDTEFDPVYRQYPVVDRMYPSGCQSGSEVPADTLTTAASYDRGFEIATHVVDLQGQVTYLTYAGLGRTREVFR